MITVEVRELLELLDARSTLLKLKMILRSRQSHLEKIALILYILRK